jgi:excisionase family DNA binding protein
MQNMTQQVYSGQRAHLFFEIVLDEIRNAVRSEVSILREDIRRIAQGKEGALLSKAKRFYTLKETAAELNVSAATVRRLIQRGLLQSSKATRHIRIPREELDQFARSTL